MDDDNPEVITTENGLSVSGNLLYSNVSSVIAKGIKQLESHNADSIVIDLSQVNKIDSAGITLFLAWRRLCEAKGKSFRINAAQEQPRSLITTNKMHLVLNIS